MEIRIKTVKEFLKDEKNRIVIVFWLLMFLTGVLLALKIMGRI